MYVWLSQVAVKMERRKTIQCGLPPRGKKKGFRSARKNQKPQCNPPNLLDWTVWGAANTELRII